MMSIIKGKKLLAILLVLFLNLLTVLPAAAGDNIKENNKKENIKKIVNKEKVRKKPSPVTKAPKTKTSISIGQTVNGALSTTDPVDPNFIDTFYIDDYVFSGTQGQKIAISMNSTAVDAWLELWLKNTNGTLTLVTYNDDVSSGNNNSRIPPTGYYTLPATGQYVIRASSAMSQETGAYTLSLMGDVATYSISGKVTLSTGTGTALSGVTMTFAKVSGTGTTVPSPVQTNASGVWSQAGFATGTTYKVTPTKAGCSFTPGYLTFNNTSTTLNFVGAVQPLPIIIGGIANGSLATTDSWSLFKGTGYYADRYTFNATAGTQVSISLSSKAFDTYLYLKSPNGTLVAYDDSSGDEWDSLIPSKGFYSLPHTGTYTIEVTSFNKNSVGAYTLNVSKPSNYMTSGWIQTSGDSWVYRDGSSLQGVTMTFSKVSGSGTVIPAPAVTDAAGKWVQKGFQVGNVYKVTPTKAGYTFSPAYLTYDAMRTRLNFKASPSVAVFGGSGKVAKDLSTGPAMSGVQMIFTKVSGNGSAPPPVLTNSLGVWSQKGFQTGTTYKVTPVKAGYTFTPTYLTFTGASSTLNFIGKVATATAKPWTFMLYGAADNDLDPYMTGDLNEIAAAGYDPDVNVVVFYDGYGSSGSLYKVLEQGGWATKVTLAEANTGNPAMLTSFIQWAKQNYPGQKYALDLWNHGGGFKELEQAKLRGIAWDDTNNNDYLTMPELRTALTNSGIAKIDLVGADACLMAQLEVAYELKDRSSIFVASEQTIPNEGWPYTPIINSLDPGTTTAVQLGQAIANSYVSTNTSNSCLSVTDQSKVSQLTTAVNSLATVLKNNLVTYKTQINNARNSSQKYFDTSYVDLYDLTLKLDANCSSMPGLTSATAAVRAAITNNAVLYNKYTSPLTGSKGLTIWMPAPGTSNFSSTMTSLYKPLQFAGATQWDEFLQAFMQ